jgi:CBS domain containing-hemolysin-like protein
LMALTIATQEYGVLSNPETTVIQNVLNLPKTKIHDIMTPRSVLFSASITNTIGDLKNKERFQQFSRIPVFAENKEEIVGMVLKSEILWELINKDESTHLHDLIRPLSKVKEDTLLADFFKNDLTKKAHMFVVVDTYDSITGVITLEDILETILGYEIIDETDKVTDMQSLVKKDK